MSRQRRRLRTYVRALGQRLAVHDKVLIFQAPPAVLPEVSSLVLQYADNESITDLAWFQDSDYIRTFREFIKAGDTGYLVYADGRCIHRSWLVHGPARINEHFATKTTIGPGDAFLHYCETAPAGRGLGAFPLVLRQVVRDNPGVRIRMAVASTNHASQRAARKANWSVAETVSLYVLAGVCWQRRQPES